MLQLVLAVSAFTVAAAVYAVIGLRWWRRARTRRAILGLVAALDIEPYHAAWSRSEGVEAAAAELLLGGCLDIDGDGAARLTEEGREPGRTPPAPPAASRRSGSPRARAGRSARARRARTLLG
ncbi:hypothetical protein ACFVT6_03720 [Streptomyces sp. NPDC058049]|uniref:hypothetical protein n=1 Tax=Streptomyces sp. NPDC058049 TaxID=3346314 RepID=UPI0036E62775